jgi:hypothetical protein
MKPMKIKKRSTKPDSVERKNRIIKLAKAQLHRDGECEIENTSIVSESTDNGAYVQAWVWVNFADTDLDKEPDGLSLSVN